MPTDLFKGLDALVKRSTEQKSSQKINAKINKETRRREGPLKKDFLHDVQTTEMKRNSTVKTRQSIRDPSTILSKLGVAGLQTPTDMLSTNDSYNSSRLMYSRANRPPLVDKHFGEMEDKISTLQNGTEGVDQLRSPNLQYALTIDDMTTKMTNDISRSQASQVLRAKIEMSTSNLDEIWHEPSQFSTSQPLSHASTANFTTTKAKVPSGKPIVESTNL